MDIYQLLELNKKCSHAFSIKYTHSKRRNDDFHKEVDAAVGHLYDYYGGKFFKEIFRDIENPPVDYSKFTMQQFMVMHKENPHKFSNMYSSSKHASAPIRKQFSINVDRLFSSYYEQYDRQFSHIFFDILHHECKDVKCKMCNSKVMFKSDCTGYSNYCSRECAISDASRVSEEGKRIATEKRTAKLRKILDDPILGAEYRKKISDKSKIYNQAPEQRKKKSDAMKERIASGLFTPCVTNSWNHWDASAFGKKFRSRFEAIFYVYCLEHNIPIEYEKLRVPYRLHGKTKTYIVDFIDNINKIVYEIKPSSLVTDQVVILKEDAARKWCSDNDYTFKFITEIDLCELSKRIVKYRDEIINYLTIYKWN